MESTLTPIVLTKDKSATVYCLNSISLFTFKDKLKGELRSI